LHLLVVGADHRTAPLAVRERCAWPPEEQPAALRAMLGGDVVEAALLCTCNRTEVYAAALDPAAAAGRIVEVLARRAGLPPAALRPHLFVRVGADDTLTHLCRVACGLESLVLGETQVLGQVKEAYQRSAEAGTVAKMLHALFHQALLCAKRVHTETALCRAPVSVGSAAVELAERALGDLRGRAAAVLGAGEMAEVIARRLREAGVARIDVVNRTAGRAAALAAGVGGAGWEVGALEQILAQADVLLTSTASPEPVVRRASVAGAMARRGGRPLVIIDIAVPRDVEPAVGEIPGVRLHNIDDLEEVAAVGRAGRAAEVAAAEEIVAEEVARFGDWLRGLDVVPLLRALIARLEGMAEAEVERTLRRLPDLSPQGRELVRRLGRGIVRKVLDEPLRRTKELAGTPQGAEAVRALSYVFGLDLPTVVVLPGGASGAEGPGR
jgi:glutamyl-tRNA reductase